VKRGMRAKDILHGRGHLIFTVFWSPYDLQKLVFKMKQSRCKCPGVCTVIACLLCYQKDIICETAGESGDGTYQVTGWNEEKGQRNSCTSWLPHSSSHKVQLHVQVP